MNQHWEPGGTARGRVVLLHGMMSTAATWWRAGPALAARGWVVDALDLPGHGDSPRSARPLDLDALVDGTAGRLGGPVDVLDGGHCLHRDLPARWVEVVGGFADAVLAARG
jgi:alpha-beta hydrolase superfamily lysophospholipase